MRILGEPTQISAAVDRPNTSEPGPNRTEPVRPYTTDCPTLTPLYRCVQSDSEAVSVGVPILDVATCCEYCSQLAVLYFALCCVWWLLWCWRLCLCFGFHECDLLQYVDAGSLHLTAPFATNVNLICTAILDPMCATFRTFPTSISHFCHFSHSRSYPLPPLISLSTLSFSLDTLLLVPLPIQLSPSLLYLSKLRMQLQLQLQWSHRTHAHGTRGCPCASPRPHQRGPAQRTCTHADRPDTSGPEAGISPHGKEFRTGTS